MAWTKRRLALFLVSCTTSLAVRLEHNTCDGGAMPSFTNKEEGTEGQQDYRKYFINEHGEKISPWHDLPYQDGPDHFVMVTEIPKYTKKKMEIATKETWNPIAQDIKKGQLREYHGPIFWNYGYVPQTWEDPDGKHQGLEQYRGDNDPLDVVEIGSQPHERGQISSIKVLGALAMIDSEELDWKLIAIDIKDPLADELKDIDNVKPHIISGIREWFRWYKTPDNDHRLNEFGFEEKALPRADAEKVITETHKAWERLRKGDANNPEKLWYGEPPKKQNVAGLLSAGLARIPWRG
eukprot:TRINITY_DN3993_c0_g4_i1.p1 TRINITY_DN3993_c0_g4~~TRINITY_DN3993_c0_g4_i1.p1  ORF type:complete len:294 (-),score=38.31 TRINITY_DN3993_c0_g4_i1:75-956(-)